MCKRNIYLRMLADTPECEGRIPGGIGGALGFSERRECKTHGLPVAEKILQEIIRLICAIEPCFAAVKRDANLAANMG